MYKNFDELPLFSGGSKKIKRELDFSDGLTLEDVRIGFSLPKETSDKLVATCKENNDDPNIVLQSLVELYLEKHSL